MPSPGRRSVIPPLVESGSSFSPTSWSAQTEKALWQSLRRGARWRLDSKRLVPGEGFVPSLFCPSGRSWWRRTDGASQGFGAVLAFAVNLKEVGLQFHGLEFPCGFL